MQLLFQQNSLFQVRIDFFLNVTEQSIVEDLGRVVFFRMWSYICWPIRPTSCPNLGKVLKDTLFIRSMLVLPHSWRRNLWCGVDDVSWEILLLLSWCFSQYNDNDDNNNDKILLLIHLRFSFSKQFETRTSSNKEEGLYYAYACIHVYC